jgi:hypothetical protein
MEAVSLPLVLKTETVHQALARLKSTERSGVVVDDGKDIFRLLYAGDLLVAREACTKFLSDVPAGEQIHLVSQADVKAHNLDLVRPLSSESQYNQLFANLAENFALIGADHDTAMLVTRHEIERETLVMTGGYQCNGTPIHYFPRPSVKVGEPCPRAGCTGLINVSP